MVHKTKGLTKSKGKIDEIVSAIYEGKTLERNGKIVINNIGLTTYVSVDDLTPEELHAVARAKKQLMG